MKQIRSAAFETNSSSSHSFSLGAGTKLKSDLHVFDGFVEVVAGEFGWEPDSYNDCHTKASYCLTWLMQVRETPQFKQLSDMFNQAICEVTGATTVLYVPVAGYDTVKHLWSDREDWGYVDHQSFEVSEEIFKSPETLKTFIFDSSSILYTDNDNH